MVNKLSQGRIVLENLLSLITKYNDFWLDFTCISTKLIGRCMKIKESCYKFSR